MARPSLRLLGVFDVRAVDGAPVLLPTRKCQALAAVLALSPSGQVPRERLLGLLWGDRGEEQARHSLSQALTSLRRALGPAVVVADRDAVALDPAAIEVDARAFLAHAASDDVAALEAAAGLVGGPLLQDFVLREAPFEEWLDTERARFARLAVEATMRLGTRAAARGEVARAGAAFARAITLDPTAEAAHLALMRLHLDHGSPAAALRQYAEAAEVLRRDLDAAPGPDLEAARQEARARGTAPAAPAEARGERKHATALALAVWPAPGAARDPEEVQARLEAALVAASAAVRAAGGQVVHASADGLLAAFGIPASLEDHAVRGCRAALAIRAVLDDPRHAGVAARVALDAGELVLRPDAAGTLAVFGLALQRAGRIASLPDAPPVAATAVVQDLARSRFAFAAHGAVALAAGEPVVALYQPSTAAAVAQRGAAGFVGRGAEVARLADACAAVAAGQGQLVAVMGEPGIGKSRLVREFIETALPPGWRVIAAGTDPQFAESAYHPVRGLLHAFFGLTGTPGPTTIRARVETVLGRLGFALSPLAAPLLSLLDCEPAEPGWARLEPATRRRRMVEAVIQLLHRQSQETPLLVVIEDLHWLDSASRDLLEDLVATLAGARIVVLVNFRPEFSHGWAGRGHFRLLRIDPLRDEAATVLLDGLLGRDPALAPLKAGLAARTGGNPFFLEECVRGLAASGALAGSAGAYRLADAAAEPVLPDSVHAVIGARVDRLTPADKQLLQVAAVIGTDVPCALLAAVAGLDELAFEGAMRRLHAEELLLPVRMLPDRLVRFKHALTHEVVTASLLRQRRRDLHAEVLAALESPAFAGGAEAVETLAHHAVQAEDWSRAARHAQAAGERSAARNANRAAIGHFGQALAARGHLPETAGNKAAAVDLHLLIRDGLFVVGAHDRIPAHLDAAAAIAAEIADAPRLTRAKLILSGWQWTVGQHAQALATADEAMAITAGLGDPLLSALAQYRRGVNLGALGRYRESAEVLFAAKALLERSGLADAIAFGGYPIVFCCSFLAWALVELGETEAATRLGREGWDFAWERPSTYTRSVIGFGHGHALVRMGRWEEAREVLESCLALFGASELPATYPFIAAPLGYLLVATGEAAAGLAHLHRANDPQIRRMAPAYAHVATWLGEAQRLVGDTAAARASLERALARARAQQERGHEAWALRCLGDLLAPAEPNAARAQYDAAESIARPLGMRPLLAEIAAGRDRLGAVPPAASGRLSAS